MLGIGGGRRPRGLGVARRVRRALPGAPGVQNCNEGVADFRRFRTRDKDVSPCGPARGRCLIGGASQF
eukprot:1242756-Alexandrium_andersonii.AAC.1